MAKFELKLPKMGESVAEATITTWLKEVGDTIEMDESVVEIATDKVDSDVPCDVEGVLVEKLFEEGEVVKVGQTFAIVETEGVAVATPATASYSTSEEVAPEVIEAADEMEKNISKAVESAKSVVETNVASSGMRFYSPLVKKIAQTEGVTQEELDALPGSGLEGRVTKDDILKFVADKKQGKTIALKTVATPNVVVQDTVKKETKVQESKIDKNTKSETKLDNGDELIELTRMGKMISDHMIHSKQKSAHVQSFIEVDVTNIVNWRNKVKDNFAKREGEKLTFTPIFMMAVAQALKKYPLVNITFDGEDKVVVKKSINLGMASALPDGNLIVPVIKNSENLNLVGMTKAVNDLAVRSKANKLAPEDVMGGTYTVTNIGSFGSIFGTPIINQPEAAILALGAIRKVPAVIETPEGDFIGIRQKMYISHSYDHRVINGALGGMFIKEIKDILEAWDVNTEI